MLLPSTALTCLLAAGFKEIEQVSATQAIIKGVIPATAGIMLIVGLRFAQPQLKIALQSGLLGLSISILFIVACFIAIALLNLPVALVLPCAGLLGIMLFTHRFKNKGEQHD
jgi:chromate transporter